MIKELNCALVVAREFNYACRVLDELERLTILNVPDDADGNPHSRDQRIIRTCEVIVRDFSPQSTAPRETTANFNNRLAEIERHSLVG